MDPYVTIKHMGHEFKTKTHSGGGKNPTWNMTFDFRPAGMDTDIEITVWDEDVTTSDFVSFFCKAQTRLELLFF
jgi:Ca2+-dependent lipid-binding protein